MAVFLVLLIGTLLVVQKVHAQSAGGGADGSARALGMDGRTLADSLGGPSAWGVDATFFVGLQAGTTPRRMLELPTTAPRSLWPLIGLELSGRFGPFRLDIAPRLEDRLLDDPDWAARTRGDDRGIALRTPAARLVGEWRWARVELGELEGNWGPPGVPGLLVSPLGYSRRGVGFSLGPAPLRLQWRTERLSSEPSAAAGRTAPRWFTVHRLRWRPSERWELAGWEAMVTSEPDGIDPARLNPLALYTFGQQFGIGDERNTSFGFDVAWRAREALWIETQLLVDDVVIWNADENPFPHRFGFTAQVRQEPLRAWGWRAWATGLSSLALNTFRPEEAFVDDGRGLGRIRPDHLAGGAELRLDLGGGDAWAPGSEGSRARGFVQESWGLGSTGDGWRPDPYAGASAGVRRGSWVPGRLRLDLGVRWRRQGVRRFDDPFPDPGSGAEVPDLPTFSPEIEMELFALHSAADWAWGPLRLLGEAQLQRRRFPRSGDPTEWAVEARAQLVWRLGRWSYTSR